MDINIKRKQGPDIWTDRCIAITKLIAALTTLVWTVIYAMRGVCK